MIVLSIVLATVASFVASAILYALPPVGALVAQTSTAHPGITVPIQMASVVFRSLVASCLVAGLMTVSGWRGPTAGALLDLALTALPAILLLGGVVHENTAIPASAIHLLDWTIKLVLIGALVGLFR